MSQNLGIFFGIFSEFCGECVTSTRMNVKSAVSILILYSFCQIFTEFGRESVARASLHLSPIYPNESFAPVTAPVPELVIALFTAPFTGIF